MQIVEATSMPWVVQADSCGCAAVVPSGVHTGPSGCVRPPASFLLVRYPRERGTWCVFLCAGHAREVEPLSEPLGRVAEAELADRRAQHALAMAGKPYRRPAPLPR